MPKGDPTSFKTLLCFMAIPATLLSIKIIMATGQFICKKYFKLTFLLAGDDWDEYENYLMGDEPATLSPAEIALIESGGFLAPGTG